MYQESAVDKTSTVAQRAMADMMGNKVRDDTTPLAVLKLGKLGKPEIYHALAESWTTKEDDDNMYDTDGIMNFIAKTGILSVFLTCISAEIICAQWDSLYTSVNLSNHQVNAECSPGDPTTNCPCSTADVGFVVHPLYAEVTSNAKKTNVFVNAIMSKAFWTFPDGSDITLDIYKYKADFRIPVIPTTSSTQTQNAESVQMMIQMWDGSNKIWQADSNAIEATWFWDLNPWRGTFSNIYVYTDVTGALELVETGLSLPVDTNWHTIEYVADFANKKFVSMKADSNIADISHIDIPLRHRPSWGPEVVYQITQESCATYPGPGYSNIFFWTTEFKDLEFSRLNYNVQPSVATNELNLQWQSLPYLKYQVMCSSNCIAWSNISGAITGDGSLESYIQSMTNKNHMFYKIQVTP